MVTGLATKHALAPALMRAEGLTKTFVQRSPFSRRKFVIAALNAVDLEIQSYCMTAIVGQSGSGKSTLAACLASLEQADSGTIWFEGQQTTNNSVEQLKVLRSKIQLVFQDSAGALNPRFTALEIIKEPLEIQNKTTSREQDAIALGLMEQVGLSPDWATRRPQQLSGGQRQRLAIARALTLKPQLLILDESLSGLDLITQSQILDLLQGLQATHALTYLLISHDIALVSRVADYIAVMHKGRVVERGPRHQLMTSPVHEHTSRLIASAHAAGSRFQEVRSGGQR